MKKIFVKIDPVKPFVTPSDGKINEDCNINNQHSFTVLNESAHTSFHNRCTTSISPKKPKEFALLDIVKGEAAIAH